MIEIDTRRRQELIDITGQVQRALEGRVQRGICLVYSLHTTTALMVNEEEPGLVQDVLERLSAIVPEGLGYQHDRIDDNAHSHIQAALLGNSVVLPIEDGGLVLGTWQRILLVELDGPRRRKVCVKAVSE